MCYQVKCRNCGKTTWDGCGMHVSCAMAGVANENRCPNWKNGARQPCSPGQASSSQSTTTTTTKEATSSSSSWLPSFLQSSK